MEIGTLSGRRYRVALDRDHVQRLDLGPGPLGNRVRCTVPLTGPVDEHWRACFRSVQVDDTGFFRFRLELTSDVVTFTRTVSGSGSEIASELKSLDFLIEAVNARASNHGKHGPAQG